MNKEKTIKRLEKQLNKLYTTNKNPSFIGIEKYLKNTKVFK